MAQKEISQLFDVFVYITVNTIIFKSINLVFE